VLAIIGVGLGTMLITVLTSLNAGIHARLGGSIHLAGQIVVAAADAPTGGLFAGGSPLTYDEVQQIAALPHVVATQAMVVGAIPTTSLQNVYTGGVALVGTEIGDPTGPAVNPPGDLLEGRGARSRSEVVGGAQVNAALRHLGASELHPGSVIKI
jgi:hypothetical protein